MSDEYLYLWAQWGVLNNEKYRFILKKFGTLAKAWKEVTPDFFRQVGVTKEKVDNLFEIRNRLSFEEISRTMKEQSIQLLHLEDDEYPKILKEVETAPPFIFVKGKLPDFHKAIAVVGTRKISSYGKRMTEDLTADLVRAGFVIVSGLAMGADSIAHQTALKGHGITVAVFGTGVDKIYPAENYNLAQRIVSSGGALISAYPLGTSSMPHHFPKRNEIVSGLCRGTLVIEGGEKSGALITADLANQQGREVFAVPSDVCHFKPSGTNKIIRKGEAKLVENVVHILEELKMDANLMKEEKDFTENEKIILERLSLGERTMDDLFEETEFNIPQLSSILVMLQLKQAVCQQGAHWYVA